jgi:hypothetical protein
LGYEVIGSKDLNSSRRHSTHGNQEKSSQEKEEKVVQSRSQVSVKFKQGKIVMTGVHSEHPFLFCAVLFLCSAAKRIPAWRVLSRPTPSAQRHSNSIPIVDKLEK